MKALVTYKKSKLELLAEHENENELAYLEENEKLFETYKRADVANKRAYKYVLQTLNDAEISYVTKWRGGAQLANDAKEADFVLAVGGDGTFIDTARYIRDETPIIGVNSDATLSQGHFCSQTAESFELFLERYEQVKDFPTRQIPRMDIYHNGELTRVALNDIVLSQGIASMQHNHVKIEDGETQLWKNTGILISTGAGSGAYMVNAGGEIVPEDDSRIQYQELLMKKTKHGFAEKIELASLNHDQRMYIDGDYDIIKLEFGDTVTCKANKHPLYVV